MAVALRWKKVGSASALLDHFMPRIRRGYPVIRPGTARLHPKGTSSRFARRAPRRLAPHNDTSGGAAVHQRPPAVELSRTWRSLSAATVKSVSTHVRRCPVHLGRPLLRLPRRFAPRNDKSGAITVLTGACTSRQRCAGSGMPLPYNSGCGRRNCFKICNCQWRSGSAATDAIGLYVLSVARLSRQRCAGPGCPRPYNTLRYDGALISHTRRGTAACGRFSGGGTARPACRTLPRRRAPEK